MKEVNIQVANVSGTKDYLNFSEFAEVIRRYMNN